MRPHFNDYLGNNPLTYVRRVMAHFDFKAPPIPIEEISNYLGLVIDEVEPPREKATPELHEILKTVPCWLERAEKRITVYRHAPRRRKRLGICHENTHYIIPYHIGINPFCPDADDPTCRKNTEREAFLGGAAMLFYPKLFIPDVLSFRSINIGAIEKLADRYDGSVEATANWYARTHPQICAVVIAEIPSIESPVLSINGHNDQNLLAINISRSLRPANLTPVWLPPNGSFRGEDMRFPMQVKYAIPSNRFPKWIPAGTRIPETSLIYKAFLSDKPLKGEIPASDLGSSSRWCYNAECLPFGVNGNRAVMTLLWLPDNQLNLNFSSPHVGW